MRAVDRTHEPCRPGLRRPRAVALLTLVCALACQARAGTADPNSDAPEGPRPRADADLVEAATYGQALERWRTAEDVNVWIGGRFEYDPVRALRLSETQRGTSGPLPITAPQDFYALPSGICVDLSRFAVETLRRIAPSAQASYLMIEFAPQTIAGNTLRRHWLAGFVRDGEHYYFADSKRPGHLAGPYASTQEFITEYAIYRGRQVVAYRELASYLREPRARVAKQAAAGR